MNLPVSPCKKEAEWSEELFGVTVVSKEPGFTLEFAVVVVPGYLCTRFFLGARRFGTRISLPIIFSVQLRQCNVLS